jgi:ATP-dependent Clp protease ATP-binding subunit ClpX
MLLSMLGSSYIRDVDNPVVNVCVNMSIITAGLYLISMVTSGVFIGRLPIIFSLQGLDEDMMVKILQEPKNAILKQYQKLLALDEVKLEFTEDALRAIAAKAMKKDTGARALRSIIEEFMLDIMYEIPKDDNIGIVTITKEYVEGIGTPMITMRGQAKLPEITS